MISKSEKGQIRQLIQQPQWKLVELVANSMCSKIESDSVVGDSEWDTLKNALLNEGQVRGIRNFIQELYNNAQDD